jgi:DNA/RNA-binding domain of Phe-tRNA-synthetase-like protein
MRPSRLPTGTMFSMIAISFDEQIRSALPELTIGIVQAEAVHVSSRDAGLWAEIDALLARVVATLQVETVPDLPQIAALRKAYRTLGKDPTRYRGSQEALIRRVLKGKGLYQINTIVDLNNLLSMECRHSIGMFDAAKIDGPVVIRAGRPGETYYGIGRDLLNVEGLPLLTDNQGPFGSPTSDSERTKVTLETTSTLTTILSFTGPGRVEAHCRRMAELLTRYADCSTDNIQLAILSADGLRLL